MIKSNRPVLNDDKLNIQSLNFACRSGTPERRWKYQTHIGLMNSEVILGHDHGDVLEFGVLGLHFILFCLLRMNFSGVMWHCNGLRKKQRAVGEHL